MTRLCVIALVASVVVGFGPAVRADASTGTTLFSFTSDPGDHIGEGETRSFEEGFTAGYIDGVVHVQIDHGGSDWSLQFRGRPGTAIIPGPYEHAQDLRGGSSTRPGISVSGEGRGCGVQSARFDVLEAVFEADGTVVRFAADFEQYCQGATGGLHGSVRFQASEDLTTPPPDSDADGVPDTVDVCPALADPEQADADVDGLGDGCDPAFQRTYLELHGEHGNSIFGGRHETLYPVDGTFGFIPFAGGVRVNFNGGTSQLWELDLAAPEGSPFVPGPYDAAGKWSDKVALLELTGVSGCTERTGRFELLEYVVSPAGAVERLSANVEQRCSRFGPKLEAKIRFNASDSPPAVGDADVDTIPDTTDNCPAAPNQAQSDGDLDGRGDACDATVDNTSLTIGRWPVRGGSADDHVWHLDTSSFTVAHTRGKLRIEADNGFTGTIWLAAPGRADLTTGSYEGARATHLELTDLPGLAIAEDSTAATCSTSVGRFDILELVTGTDGAVVRLAADFSLTCTNGDLRTGQIRYNASTPVPPLQPATVRLAGSDRIATAIEASRDLFGPVGSTGAGKDPRAATAVVLARSDSFADAIAGAPLAAKVDGPLLLTPSNELEPRTLGEIERTLAPGRTVHVLGGTTALSAKVEASLTSAGYVVERHHGPTRAGTAVAIADALGNPSRVLLVTGADFPDGLTAGAAASHIGAAVLLTDGTTMAPATSAYLSAHPDAEVTTIGGPAATARPGSDRIVGSDRYDTATRVAARFFPAPAGDAGLASGETFADALAGGAHISHLGGPLLLTQRTQMSPAARTYASLAVSRRLVVYGGSNAISTGLDPFA